MTSIPWKLIILGVLLAVVAKNVLDTLQPFQAQPPTNNPENCKLYEGPTGAEDMVLTEYGWIITSSLDWQHLVENGVGVCERNTGGLWAFHPTLSKQPVRLEIPNLPDDIQACFMTHGLFLSTSTQRLYAVTHTGSSSSVQVFDVGHVEQKDSMPTLSWVRSITSEFFLPSAPNNVVEGVNKNEIYVTLYLPFGMPKHGRPHPSTITERIQQFLLLPILLFGLKLSTIQHCIFSDNPNIPATCSLATTLKFRGANGIAISPNRRTVVVNDVFARTLHVLERQYDQGGSLELVESIPLQYAVDNVEYKLNNNGQEEELWMGTVPNVLVAATNEGKPIEERANVPGGLAVLSKDGTTGKWGKQRLVYNHDGSLLSQVSSGRKLDSNGKVLLGSPFAPGILVCDDANAERIF